MININLVNGDHHYLATCPCMSCKEERVRRGLNTSNRRDKHLTPEAAYRLGYISQLTPEGSLCRQLMNEQG